MAKLFVVVVLLIVGTGPAKAVCRFLVKELEAEVTSRSQAAAAPAAHREEVVHAPAGSGGAIHRLPAVADRATPHGTAPADASAFRLGNNGIAAASASTRGVGGVSSAPLLVGSQPAVSAPRHAFSRAHGTSSIIGGPQPNTAYNYTSGLVVDSTDNPTGITSIGASDTLAVTNGLFEVGSFHTGVFTQNGGAVTVNSTSPLVVGNHSGSSGTYNLKGGTINSSVSAFVGYDGIAVLDQTGGTFNITGPNSLIIGFDDNSNSQYNLSAGNINTFDTIVSDHTNVSVFNQTGGILTTGSLALSNFVTGSNGTYNLDGGTLNAGYIRRGSNTSLRGTGTFNFNGGTLRPTGNDNPGAATPFYFMSDLTTAQVRAGGAVIDTNGFNITIAQPLIHSTIGGDNPTDGGLIKNGAGTLTLTAANTYTGSTIISAGTVTLGATGSITGPGNMYVGIAGTGTMNQDGGSLELTNEGSLIVGFDTGNRGTYNLTAGSIVTSQVIVGSNGVGTFNQSGGSVTTFGLRNSISVGNGIGASSYNLSAGTITTGQISIGTRDNFIGTFTQSGGINNAGQLLLSGVTTGSTGVYNLDGGTLNTSSVGSGYFGVKGTSVFQFNGGTLKPTASDNPGAASNPTTFFTGLTKAVVRDGGAVIDTAGFNVTVNQALVHSTASGDNATDGGLTKLGAGTLTVLGTSTYTGDTTVKAGTLSVPTGGNLSATGSVTILTGGSLSLSGTGNIAASDIRVGVGTVNQTGGTLSSNNGFVIGVGGLGTYNLSGGTLTSGSSARFGYSSGGTAFFNQTGGTFMVGNPLYLGFVAGSNATYTLSAGNLSTSLTFVASDNNTSAFTQTGGLHTTGQLLIATNVAGSNGTYRLDGGTLNTGAVATQGSPGASTFLFNGGTLQASASNTAFFEGLTTAQVRNGGAIIDTNNFNSTIAQTITHSTIGGDNAIDGGLTKNAGGTLTLTGVSTYTGDTHVNAGALTVSTGGSVAGHNLLVGNAVTASVLGTSAVGIPSANAGAAASLIVNGTGSIVLDGTGVLVADGTTNGFSSVLVTGGVLSTQAATVGRSGTATFTQQGGAVSSTSLLLGALAGGNGTYELDTGTMTTGAVAGGAGVSTFNFDGGIVRAAASTPTFLQGLTTAQVRDSGAYFDTNGQNITIAQTLIHSTIGGDNATDGGLVKMGNGILSLTGANTYTGSSAVNAGTLAANNTTGSATGQAGVTVYNTATLAGNGTVAGNVTLNSGSTLSPGNGGPGRLTLGGTLNMTTNSAFAVELGGTTAGSQYDQAALGGPLMAGGLFTLAGNLNVTTVSGFTLAVNQKFFIIDETGTNVVGGTGTFANAPGGIYTDAAGDTFLINYADIDLASGNALPNDVSLTVLTVAVVPEPSTWALLLLGAGCGVMLRGRWNRRSAATAVARRS